MERTPEESRDKVTKEKKKSEKKRNDSHKSETRPGSDPKVVKAAAPKNTTAAAAAGRQVTPKRKETPKKTTASRQSAERTGYTPPKSAGRPATAKKVKPKTPKPKSPAHVSTPKSVKSVKKDTSDSKKTKKSVPDIKISSSKVDPLPTPTASKAKIEKKQDVTEESKVSPPVRSWLDDFRERKRREYELLQNKPERNNMVGFMSEPTVPHPLTRIPKDFNPFAPIDTPSKMKIKETFSGHVKYEQILAAKAKASQATKPTTIPENKMKDTNESKAMLQATKSKMSHVVKKSSGDLLKKSDKDKRQEGIAKPASAQKKAPESGSKSKPKSGKKKRKSSAKTTAQASLIQDVPTLAGLTPAPLYSCKTCIPLVSANGERLYLPPPELYNPNAWVPYNQNPVYKPHPVYKRELNEKFVASRTANSSRHLIGQNLTGKPSDNMIAKGLENPKKSLDKIKSEGKLNEEKKAVRKPPIFELDKNCVIIHTVPSSVEFEIVEGPVKPSTATKRIGQGPRRKPSISDLITLRPEPPLPERVPYKTPAREGMDLSFGSPLLLDPARLKLKPRKRRPLRDELNFGNGTLVEPSGNTSSNYKFTMQINKISDLPATFPPNIEFITPGKEAPKDIASKSSKAGDKKSAKAASSGKSSPPPASGLIFYQAVRPKSGRPATVKKAKVRVVKSQGAAAAPPRERVSTAKSVKKVAVKKTVPKKKVTPFRANPMPNFPDINKKKKKKGPIDLEDMNYVDWREAMKSPEYNPFLRTPADDDDSSPFPPV